MVAYIYLKNTKTQRQYTLEIKKRCLVFPQANDSHSSQGKYCTTRDINGWGHHAFTTLPSMKFNIQGTTENFWTRNLLDVS